MGNNNTLLLLGAAAVGYVLINNNNQQAAATAAAAAQPQLQPQQAAQVVIPENAAQAAPQTATAAPAALPVASTQSVTPPPVVQPALTTLYPYLIPGAPLPMPMTYDDGYYKSYIYPAMLEADGSLASPFYEFGVNGNPGADQYLANYVDIQGWLASFKVAPGSQAAIDKLNYHWKTYGCAEQRTFLQLPWGYMQLWIPPAKPPSSGGVFGDILKGVTAVGAGVAIVASGGALTPIVAPAAGLALSAESTIKGVNKLCDNEIELLFNGAAIIIDILPFYNQANRPLVKEISNHLHNLLNEYSQ